MKKLILFSLFAFPLFSWAENCRFSQQLTEHVAVTSESCTEKLCASVVVCDSGTKIAVCKTKSGSCDHIDASTCETTSQTLAKDATFKKSAWKTAPPASFGGGGGGGGR